MRAARSASALAAFDSAGLGLNAARSPAVMRRSADQGYAMPPPVSLAAVPPRPVVQRKCTSCDNDEKHGNGIPVQARLEVGPVGDRHEQEADAIAGRVMAMRLGEPQPAAQLAGPVGAGPVRAKAAGSGGGETIAASESQLTSGGSDLPASTRGFFEPRLGRDLSDVKVHTGDQASALSSSIQARAFTYRNHIWLGASERAAPSFTMAHELAHVMQQTNGPVAPGVQRDPDAAGSTGAAAGGGCSVELCFVPIGIGGLGKVGAVHAVINLTSKAGKEHAEVDPNQHMGVADALGGKAARISGIHSHVVLGTGHKTGTTCLSISATCADIGKLKASISRYEDFDVAYSAPPVGPNSNSFAEWVLTDAGISTSGISAPAGAIGFDYYASRPAERGKPPRTARKASSTATTCKSPVTPANSFASLIALIRKAEVALTACGVTDVGDRLNILRGIFYGTPWSKDNDTSQSDPIRTATFNSYSNTAQPQYALECMDCGLFLSLGASQDVSDAGKKVDVGHMLIGMDARRSSRGRSFPHPIGFVPGVEATTWVGDLGGGAARLAVDRTTTPTLKADKYFKGTDYGGPINLEGDIAGYVVGLPSGGASGAVTPLTIAAGKGVADTIAAFLIGSGGAAPGRNTRCTDFLKSVGGTFSSSGALTNRASVKTYLGDQIESFACWYMVNFMRQHGGIDMAKATDAAHHLAGVSVEMAEVFLAALEGCAKTTGGTIAPGAAPTATAKALVPTCKVALGAAGLSKQAGDLVEEGKKKGQETLKDAKKAWDNWHPLGGR